MQEQAYVYFAHFPDVWTFAVQGNGGGVEPPARYRRHPSAASFGIKLRSKQSICKKMRLLSSCLRQSCCCATTPPYARPQKWPTFSMQQSLSLATRQLGDVSCGPAGSQHLTGKDLRPMRLLAVPPELHFHDGFHDCTRMRRDYCESSLVRLGNLVKLITCTWRL